MFMVMYTTTWFTRPLMLISSSLFFDQNLKRLHITIRDKITKIHYSFCQNNSAHIMASNDDVLKAAHLCIADNRFRNTAVDLQVSAIAHQTRWKISRVHPSATCAPVSLWLPCPTQLLYISISQWLENRRRYILGTVLRGQYICQNSLYTYGDLGLWPPILLAWIDFHPTMDK